MKLTPVEWLQIQIKNCPTAENLINNIDGFLMEAKSMEKDKVLSQHDVSRRSEQLVAFLKWVGDGYDFENNAEKIVKDYMDEGN